MTTLKTITSISFDNLPELTGTPKQIAWAKDIRKEKIPEIQKLIKDLIDYPPKSPEADEKTMEAAGKILYDLIYSNKAKDWIDVRKVRFAGWGCDDGRVWLAREVRFKTGSKWRGF
jgi:hypothetical protein